MTRRSRAAGASVGWILGALALMYVINDRMTGPGSVFLLFGLVACTRWADAAYRKWQATPRPSTRDAVRTDT